MKHISQRQGGMTALGIFIILGMIACFIAFGFRVFPLYNEYLGVKSVMAAVISQPAKKRSSTKKIRALFLKNAKVNSLYEFDRNNIKDHLTIKKSKNGKTKYMNFVYQRTQPLFKNFHLMIDVDETLEIPATNN